MNEVQVTNKQIKIFFAVGILLVIGFVGVMATSSSSSSGNTSPKTLGQKDDGFTGDRGETLAAEGDSVYVDEASVSDGNMHHFNYYSQPQGKNIYFFIVKAPDRTYRAAADACEVCHESGKGFTQVGDQIRCENCRTMYSKSQIAMQKGGCNPRPIDKNVKVSNGRLAINVLDIENSADLF